MRVSSDGRRGVVVYAPAAAADDGSGTPALNAAVDDEDAGEDAGNQKLRASVAHACLHSIGTLLMKPPSTALLPQNANAGRGVKLDSDSDSGSRGRAQDDSGAFTRLPVEVLLWTMQSVVLPLAGAGDAAVQSRFGAVSSLEELPPSIPGALGMLPGGSEIASEATSLATRVLAHAAPHLREVAPEWFFDFWIEFVRAMSEDIARWGVDELSHQEEGVHGDEGGDGPGQREVGIGA